MTPLETPPGLVPYARAMRDYHAGDTTACLVLQSSLGEYDTLPMSLFFREEGDFFPFEVAALELCRGRVLDAGAGTGVHSLVLQRSGMDVTAVEMIPEAVEIMRDRGVENVRHADMFSLAGEAFDTVLMMMNGVGPVGTLDGLDRFLVYVRDLVAPGGQILVDSAAAAVEDPPEDAPPVEWPAPPGDYAGEAWIQLEYRGAKGPPFRELYVDYDTLARRAARVGLNPHVAFSEDGAYTAVLRRV